MGNYVLFNPSKANELAKFQGSLAGAQAGNAYYGGVAVAPTSIMNQSGYYALQDTSTGQISVKKLANDSLFTNQWHDQSTGNKFNFSNSSGGFDISSLSRNMTPDQIAALDTNG